MKIIKSFRKSLSLRIKDGEVIVKAPFFMFDKTINDFILKHKPWIDKQLEVYNSKPKLSVEEINKFKRQAKEYIPNRVKEIAKENGFIYNNIRITSAKTRWGSCTSMKNLNFSYYLIKAPKETIDYVIVHELAHLKEMNHSKRFWDTVEKIMPDYKKHVKWLKVNGNKLIF